MTSFLARAAVAVVIAASAGAAAAAECDVKKGEKVFKRCKACHTLEADNNRTGPHLFGIVGRPVATVEGFNYSKPMKEFAADGKTWDLALLDEFIKKPKKLVPGTIMRFNGLKKDQQRADLNCYLETIK